MPRQPMFDTALIQSQTAYYDQEWKFRSLPTKNMMSLLEMLCGPLLHRAIRKRFTNARAFTI